MVYESVNLKGVVYKSKQNSFSFQPINTCAGFANVAQLLYFIHRALNKFSIELNRKLLQSSVN